MTDFSVDEESALVSREKAVSLRRYAARKPLWSSRSVVINALGLAGLCAIAIAIAVATTSYSRYGHNIEHHHHHLVDDEDDDDDGYESRSWEVPLFGERETKSIFSLPEVDSRCDFVISSFRERDEQTFQGATEEELRAKHILLVSDLNTYNRATAQIFWKDFSTNGDATDGWGRGLLMIVEEKEREVNDYGIAGALARESQGRINARSTWTWVTGDQHLSNFGAWRNRHGVVVYGVNDFDEGAIYDFNVDVLRIAVSICNHASTNGLSKKHTESVLDVFTKSYIDTVVGYVGNEDALLFELTSETAKGKLKHFLEELEEDRSRKKQLRKFTTVNDQGFRRFIKGPVDTPDGNTRLAAVTPQIEADIRAAITSTRYGATMMKLGWAVPQWDDEFFSVLDVAARVNSGIGSYGVDRYYVLMKGTDGLLDEYEDGGAVILDVKYEPAGAVHGAISGDDLAWYRVMFQNEATRVVEAQRRLTSYVDPFLGWIELPDRTAGGVTMTTTTSGTNSTSTRPFYVRQRSPWKDSLDLDDVLDDVNDFEDFAEQIARSTATSHVRGSVAKAPGDFKTSIATLLGGDYGKPWRKAVRRLAFAYHGQVLLDYQCYRDYVNLNGQSD